MPDPTVIPGAHRPVRSVTELSDLGAGRATVWADETSPGLVGVSFGDSDARVVLRDEPAVLHRLLTDAVAQVDAIGP